MKDLDFDELDKAVNSLMAGVPKTPMPSNDTEKTVTISSNDQPAASAPVPSPPPVVDTPVPPMTKPSAPSSPPRTSTVPAARRSGRFMDVVRPAAPVKKQDTPAKVSRQGLSLEPVSPSVEPSSVSPTEPIDSSSTSPVAPGTSQSSGDWPDPLDVAGFSKETSEGVTPKEPTNSVPEPAVSEEESVESPLTSPFLPDTKVEKRPLGANAIANAGITEPSDATVEQPPREDPDDQLPATLEDTKSILPAELHSDLIAIESDTTSPEVSESDSSVGEKKPEPWKAPADQKEDSSESSKPSIPISIPQQYKEEASTGEKESGAIYDTDSYHKPLAHPAKQKSGWMWVVWILLILVIGAGGGAALYFLRLV